MIETIKKLSLGVILIALAGGILLNADRGSRRRGEKKAPSQSLRVAFVQHASIPSLDEGAEGVFKALADRGYSDGGKITVKHYNSEADIGTANSIAREVTGGGNDLIISISTVSLQTVANANRNGSRTRHVFGIVTDPYAAGVGIDPTNHALHPPYMTGYGSMQPVESVFKIARAMRPELRTVGLVWNAAEANSLAQTKAARKACSDLGITLLEANAENSSAALESLNSLISRGVEAVWLSGDITVTLASDSIINTCKKAGIPTLSSNPPKVSTGALFDLGANYREIGMAVGNLAADVLDGKSPGDIPVENLIPKVFYFNDTVLSSLKQKWVIPDDLRKEANGWITATETNLPAHPQTPAKLSGPQPGHQYKIGLAYFAPEAACESCIQGIIDGLRDMGFVEGNNLEVRRAHAQSEIANIPLLLQNFDSSDVDLILPMSTPVINASCGMVRKKPVVFTYCNDPVAAGAGKSFTDHLPNVTGIGSFPPVAEMVELIRKVMPDATTVGTIYNASEANSVKVIEVAKGLFAESGMKLDEITVSSSADVLQAAQALAGRHVDAIYIQGDNTVLQGFEAVVKAARDAHIPIFVDDPDVAKRGAVACVGLGYYKPGYAAAKPLARVLMGESPAKIPMENISEKVLWLNLPEAEKIGITFPKEILDQAAGASRPPSDKTTGAGNN
jgi:ABC-type uncharacterized transport system substrate-binding protein